MTKLRDKYYFSLYCWVGPSNLKFMNSDF